MKKTLYHFLMMALGLVSLAACTPEVDEIFDKSATDRVEEAKANVKEILKSAKNGWRVEYYASTSYGGYNVLMKFDDDNVTVASEKVGKNHVAGFDADGKLITTTSHYKIAQSKGIVLSFDEMNETFHYFSDPANADGIGTNGTGMSGDFEFNVMNYSKECIELRGKKHNARIMMYPMGENDSWEQFYKDISATELYMSSSIYQFVVKGSDRKVVAQQSYHTLRFQYYNDEEELVTVSVPYIILRDGYKFYDTYTVDGVDITGLEKGETEEYFYFTGNHDAYLLTYMPPLAETISTGMWFMTYEDMGQYAQPKWDYMREKLKTSGANGTKSRLYWALIGTYSGKTAFHMQAGSDYCYYGIKCTSVEDDENAVTIKVNTAVYNKAGKTYYTKYGMKEAMEPFVGKSGKTFTVQTDNRRHPSYLILTDKSDPTNVIKLWAEEKMYPYGKLDEDD